MGEENTFLASCPFKHSWIIRPGEAYILNAHKIEIRFPSQQITDYIMIEILIRS